MLKIELYIFCHNFKLQLIIYQYIFNLSILKLNLYFQSLNFDLRLLKFRLLIFICEFWILNFNIRILISSLISQNFELLISTSTFVF